jgi:hypothetical protein
MIHLPGEHISGWSQHRNRKEVGAPHGYEAFYGGMDVGVTNHPSEIIIVGQVKGSDELHVLTRVHLQRINIDDQMFVVELLFRHYGDSLVSFGIDQTGVGFPLVDQLSRYEGIGTRIHGYNFSKNYPVGFEDRELKYGESRADLAIMRNVVEASTDWLRNDYVDLQKIKLPFDNEIIMEMQGQTYTVQKDNGSPYGTRRVFGGGSFHTLDALKMVTAAKFIPPIQKIIEGPDDGGPILDLFV